MTHFLYKLWRSSRLVSSRIFLDSQTGFALIARSYIQMEWSSDADTSFSSLNPISSKEDISTSLISSTSDVINTGLHVNTPLSSPLSTNLSTCSSLPQDDQNCRKSKILPQSLLLSVTKKVRDGTVSKSEIVSNDLASSNSFLSQLSPLSVNSFDSSSRLVNATDSNTSDIDSNSSQLAVKVEVSVDGEDKTLCTNSDTSICTIYSDDETRNRLKIEKPAKRIPNYFISIQFSDPEIYRSLKEVHKSIMKKNGNCSLAVVPLHSLHMTLAVMRLENEEDMACAKSALNRCGDELRPKYTDELLELPLQGLGNFRHSVVFAKVHPGEHVAKLEEIADVVQKKFCEEGLVDDKRDFTPHVTVLKLSRVGKKLTKKTGLKKIYPDIYEEFVDTYFGMQKVHCLQLCSVLKAKDISGYYHVEHKIDFGTEITPDDDSSAPIVKVNEEKEEDSLNETPAEPATRQNLEPINFKNTEDLILEDGYKLFSETKLGLKCGDTRQSLNKVMYPYKSELFIYISGEKNENAPPELSISQEKAETDNSEAQILTTILEEEAQTDNNFSASINLPENVFIGDKLASNDQEKKASSKVTEKIDKSDVINHGKFLGEIPLQTNSSHIRHIPTVIITQAEMDKSALVNMTEDSRINSDWISLTEDSPSRTTISDITGNVTPQTPSTFQNVTSDISVSGVSIEVEDLAKHNQISSPSCVLQGELELAEEATEGLASSSDGQNLVSNEIGEDKDTSSVTSETADGLNIIPPHVRKRRKKMGKCVLM